MNLLLQVPRGLEDVAIAEIQEKTCFKVHCVYPLFGLLVCELPSAAYGRPDGSAAAIADLLQLGQLLCLETVHILLGSFDITSNGFSEQHASKEAATEWFAARVTQAAAQMNWSDALGVWRCFTDLKAARKRARTDAAGSAGANGSADCPSDHASNSESRGAAEAVSPDRGSPPAEVRYRASFEHFEQKHGQLQTPNFAAALGAAAQPALSAALRPAALKVNLMQFDLEVVGLLLPDTAAAQPNGSSDAARYAADSHWSFLTPATDAPKTATAELAEHAHGSDAGAAPSSPSTEASTMAEATAATAASAAERRLRRRAEAKAALPEAASVPVACDHHVVLLGITLRVLGGDAGGDMPAAKREDYLGGRNRRRVPWCAALLVPCCDVSGTSGVSRIMLMPCVCLHASCHHRYAALLARVLAASTAISILQRSSTRNVID